MHSSTSSFKRLFLIFLAFPLIVCLWGFGLPCIYEETFLGELKHKIKLLEETEGPRIILVGGSAVAFGIDSNLLQEQLPDYQVVNFGMYAALGTSVMLDLSQSRVKKGDIVILVPELQEQSLSDYFDSSIMWQALDGDFREILNLPKEKNLQLAGTFCEFAGQKLRCFAAGEKMMPQSVYARSSFNAKGDVDSPLCERNIMINGVDSGMPIVFDKDTMDEWYVGRLQAYRDLLAKKGASLWYGVCPLNKSAIEKEEAVDQYYEAVLERTGIPVIGDPHDSVMEKEWFYDTNFHLNNAGKIVFTKHMVEAIKAMLCDNSQTIVEMPKMPSMETPVVEDGDDSDEECFAYKETGDGYAIVGVLREKESMVIPSHHDGKAVIAIESVDCGAREILVQGNIRRIMNGAFAGCGLLERIVMKQTVPSVCQVSIGLLDGTNADIYVPMGYATVYKTDYFWSVHSDRIQEME